MEQHSIKSIRFLLNKGDVADALDSIEKIEESQSSAELLILKAVCIQLSDGDNYSIEDAEECLKRALQIDENSVEALNELGWLYFNVYDSPSKANLFFNRSLAILPNNIDAVLGKAKCMIEVSSPQSA